MVVLLMIYNFKMCTVYHLKLLNEFLKSLQLKHHELIKKII